MNTSGKNRSNDNRRVNNQQLEKKENPMLNQNQETKIKEIKNAHAQDKVRRQKVDLRKKNHFMGFSAWMKHRHQKGGLQETVLGSPVEDSLLAWIPMSAPLDDKVETASQVAAQIVRLAEQGDTTITALSVAPEN